LIEQNKIFFSIYIFFDAHRGEVIALLCVVVGGRGAEGYEWDKSRPLQIKNIIS